MNFRFFFLILCVLIVSGACVPHSGTSTGGTSWPLQTYPYASHTGVLPLEPVCLISAEVDGGFRSNRQFEVCRIDMQSFQDAMGDHYIAAESELRSIFDKLIKDVTDKYNCYSQFLEQNTTGHPSASCSPLNVPQFNGQYVVNGLEYDLGVPRCIRKNEGYNFAPKTKYDLDKCRREVEIFTGNSSFGHSLYSKSAQAQYDTYLRNLRFEIDSKIDDAIRKFNCFANGEKFCI